jgi:hypothetical protein
MLLWAPAVTTKAALAETVKRDALNLHEGEGAVLMKDSDGCGHFATTLFLLSYGAVGIEGVLPVDPPYPRKKSPEEGKSRYLMCTWLSVPESDLRYSASGEHWPTRFYKCSLNFLSTTGHYIYSRNSWTKRSRNSSRCEATRASAGLAGMLSSRRQSVIRTPEWI